MSFTPAAAPALVDEMLDIINELLQAVDDED